MKADPEIPAYWWVCAINQFGIPDWQSADGPHDDREGCEKAIALMNRLDCIEKRDRVICEVLIHPEKESAEELNQDAINVINSYSKRNS